MMLFKSALLLTTLMTLCSTTNNTLLNLQNQIAQNNGRAKRRYNRGGVRNTGRRAVLQNIINKPRPFLRPMPTQSIPKDGINKLSSSKSVSEEKVKIEKPKKDSAVREDLRLLFSDLTLEQKKNDLKGEVVPLDFIAQNSHLSWTENEVFSAIKVQLKAFLESQKSKAKEDGSKKISFHPLLKAFFGVCLEVKSLKDMKPFTMLSKLMPEKNEKNAELALNALMQASQSSIQKFDSLPEFKTCYESKRKQLQLHAQNFLDDFLAVSGMSVKAVAEMAMKKRDEYTLIYMLNKLTDESTKTEASVLDAFDLADKAIRKDFLRNLFSLEVTDRFYQTCFPQLSARDVPIRVERLKQLVLCARQHALDISSLSEETTKDARMWYFVVGNERVSARSPFHRHIGTKSPQKDSLVEKKTSSEPKSFVFPLSSDKKTPANLTIPSVAIPSQKVMTTQEINDKDLLALEQKLMENSINLRKKHRAAKKRAAKKQAAQTSPSSSEPSPSPTALAESEFGNSPRNANIATTDSEAPSPISS